ncbi:MAG: hypothetical protein M1832_002276 [Thelocarpon impressellum]|nr:MAG: hypothetical protein M1832_002276 [Thelocarpon impressellum]
MSTTQRYVSEEVDVSPLGAPLPFEFAGKTAKNRFLKAAMTERLSSWDPERLEARGVPSPRLVNVYRRWGEGGFGVLLTGNVMIEPDQLEAPGNAIVPRGCAFEGERFERFRDLATEAKRHGSLIVAQVSHPGRQAQEATQPHPISASDVQLTMPPASGMTFAKPRPATQEDIDGVVEGFAHAAEFLAKAGFDGIQLHGAHGYLLSQFLSPTTNQRTDKYGGSLANRSRLIMDVARAVRARVPADFVLGIKVNSVEFQDKGFAPAEARELCRALEANRFDFVELSGGTYETSAFAHKRDSTRKREAFFLDFADAIAPELSRTKAYVTGGFKTAGAMAQALKSVDGVGLGRPAAQEPRLPADILAGRVTGAILQRFDEANFAITNVAAGTQIRQLGKDQEPADFSLAAVEQSFLADMAAWRQRRQADGGQALYGYVDLSAEPVPYGASARL